MPTDTQLAAFGRAVLAALADHSALSVALIKARIESKVTIAKARAYSIAREYGLCGAFLEAFKSGELRFVDTGNRYLILEIELYEWIDRTLDARLTRIGLAGGPPPRPMLKNRKAEPVGAGREPAEAQS